MRFAAAVGIDRLIGETPIVWSFSSRNVLENVLADDGLSAQSPEGQGNFAEAVQKGK